MPKTKGGRRLGSRTRKRVCIIHELPACAICGSTLRTPYENQRVETRSGSLGKMPYTHVVHRDCACGNCGTIRRELFFENRIGIAIRSVNREL
jgi:hypothetical protein